MATKLATIIADFTTQLASELAVGGTTATLSSATDDDGVALPSGRYFFTIDAANSKKEHISCDLSGTALTNIKTVSRQGVETAGVLRKHRIGASIGITDFAHILQINALLAGTTDLNYLVPLKYDGTATISDLKHLATKAYVDGIAIAGSPDAAAGTKGITRLSVAPVSASIPIAVGNNDPRVPTADPTTLFSPLGIVPGLVSPYAGSSAPTGWLLCDGSAVSRATYASLFGITGTTFGAGDGSTTFNLPDLRSRLAIGAGTGTKVATFASRSSNVITVTGLTNAANNEFQTGQAVVYVTSGSVITGLTSSTTYYIVRTGNLTFSLATTLANAIAGTVITLSSDGSGTQTFTQTLTARTRGDTGGEENHSLTTAELAAHAHNENRASAGSGTSIGVAGGNPTTTPVSYGINTDSTGGSTSHNIMGPFVVLNYIIKV